MSDAKTPDYQKEFHPVSTPNKLADEVQAKIDSVISGCEDVDWSEDQITFGVVKRLRKILAGYKLPSVVDNFAESKFDFEAYKLTGEAEKTHGDIAVVVTRKFSGIAIPVSGVAFYEAKAEYQGRFPSFKIQQLRRLVTNTPKLSYLIYSKKRRMIGADDWPSTGLDYRKFAHLGYESVGKSIHAVTIDANFLKMYRDIGFAASVVGQSFGTHFVKRVLSGRDLDYSRPVDQTIRRWIKYTKRSAPLIVSVSVHGEEEYTSQPQLPYVEKTKIEKIEPCSIQLQLPEFEKMKFSENF